LGEFLGGVGCSWAALGHAREKGEWAAPRRDREGGFSSFFSKTVFYLYSTPLIFENALKIQNPLIYFLK
jgi:hypothetical protein